MAKKKKTKRDSRTESNKLERFTWENDVVKPTRTSKVTSSSTKHDWHKNARTKRTSTCPTGPDGTPDRARIRENLKKSLSKG